MDHQALQAAFKRDLMTIPTLKLGILSARDLYGALALFVFKYSCFLLAINMAIQTGLYSIGEFVWVPSLSLLLKCWVGTLVASSFLMLVSSQFILFGKMVQSRLESTAFIKHKCRQFARGFFIVYILIYGLLMIAFNSMMSMDRNADSGLTFVLVGSQIASLVGSLMLVNIVASIEMNRLGLGVVFEVVEAFAAQLTGYAEKSLTIKQPGVDDER